MGERGFGKLISPFSEAIVRRSWGLFCEHKAPGFVSNSALGLLYGHGILTIYYYDDLHVYYI